MSNELTNLLASARRSADEGRLAQAEQLTNRVLVLDPPNAEANLIMGRLAAQTGRFSLAIQHLQRALEVAPDNYEALIWLAPLMRKRGDLEAALGLARKAVSLDDTDSAGHSVLGSCLLAAGLGDEAAVHLAHAIEIEPNAAVLHHQLAQALEAAGRHEDAARSYRTAISLSPEAVDSYVSLAQLVASRGQPSAAADLFRKAYELEPRSARGQLNLGRAELEDKQPEQAVSALRTAISLEPRMYPAYILQATAHRQLGQFDDAERSLAAAVKVNPRLPQAYCEFVYCRRMGEADCPMLEAMKSFAADPKLRPVELRHLEFALGKAFDDLGDFEEAMIHFDEANRVGFGDGAKFAPLKPVMFDLDRKALAELSAHGSKQDSAIFVVGMMRSGTTLMEQMLTCHPEVEGVGESPFWGKNVDGAAHDAAEFEKPGTLKALGEQYSSQIAASATGGRRVVDKMPSNYRRLGAIHAALPEARFVHMRRHPVDTCLSIYTTPNRGDLPFAFDKQRIVEAYKDYLSQMAHWREVLPPERFIEIDYEDLVQNPERVMLRLLDFLGLPWDDRCLRPQDNDAPVSTPSLWQVRQPLYHSSIGRWKNYEPWLGALREVDGRE